MTISVIMSTYFREQPRNLDAAMQSIWMDQTRKPEQIVLVKDGQLTPELDAVVDKWNETIGEALCIVCNKEKMGLAAALNRAIEVATGDLLARMDSDDISCPDRFCLQEKYMAEHPDVDILGGGIREFNDKGTVNNIRKYPATMDEIKATIHRLSPLAHPSVMFRRRFFDAGFRYDSKYYLCEDITMWFNAVSAGRVINNLPDIILDFRRNEKTIGRRKETVLSEFRAYNHGIYNLCGLFTTRYIFSFMRLIFRMLPTCMSNRIYEAGKIRNGLSR